MVGKWNRVDALTIALIVLGGLLLFVPGLGSVHLFDWDEVNFAESAREMIATGDYLRVQVNYEPFWEKPPFFIWLQVGAMKMFGVNEMAARLPNAFCGILTLFSLYYVGRRVRDRRLGWVWVMVYVGSILPFFYFKSGIIDPWFNLFIFWGVCFLARYTDDRGCKVKNAILSGAFIGLGVLTKGPVALLLFGLTFVVWFYFSRWCIVFKWGHVWAWLGAFVLIGGSWYVVLAATGGVDLLRGFVEYHVQLFRTEDAGHGGFLLYHFVVLLFGVFPASFLALPMFDRNALLIEGNERVKHLYRWMMMLFWVVLLTFTVVRTKIVHYSSLCYFPFTFMAALYVERLLDGRKRIRTGLVVAVVIMGVLLGAVGCVLPFFDKMKHVVEPLVDSFTRGNLQANGEWGGYEWIVGVVVLVSVVLFAVWRRKNIVRAVVVLMVGMTLFTFLTMLLLVPRVERYTQGALISFYEEKVGEDCYIFNQESEYNLHRKMDDNPLGVVRGYSQYFYNKSTPLDEKVTMEWLLHGDLDKPCYFVLRNYEKKVAHFEEEVPDAQFVEERNGFLVFVR